MTLWCHGWGCKSLQTMYHIHIGCIQSVLAPWYAVDGHMGAPLYCYTCGGRGQILKNWGMGEPEWCCGVMVKAARGFRLYHIHIGCIQCVLAPWYPVDGHMGAPLHWYLCRWGWILENWWEVEPKWHWDVMVEAVNHPLMHPTSILDVCKVFETFICCGWASYGWWVHPYTVIHVQAVNKFWKIGWRWSTNDVGVLWFRL
jgi:hypothetical protein